MRRHMPLFLMIAVALALFTPGPGRASAQGTVIKLATMVPEGSVWHQVLLDLGDDWNRGTAGRVSLKIYPGGVAGTDLDMVRKMRIGQVHAAALTVVGLAEIDDAFMIFETPMLFETYDELFHVLDKMEPVLKKRLEAKGFVLLNWGHAGWLHFFTKDPVRTVDDLKKTRMFVPAGDDRMVQEWKNAGFHPVALAMTDILPGLQTGMIDALPLTPLGVLMLQWFRSTPNMLDVGMAPLVGGLVIQKRAWDKIAPADQAVLLKGCARAEARLATRIPGEDKSAVEEMKKRGLTVNTPSPGALAQWRELAHDFAGRMRGKLVPAEILDMALRERDAYRKSRAASDKP